MKQHNYGALDSFIEYAIKNKSSDLHLSVESPPIIRVDGELSAIPNQKILTAKDIMEMFSGIMTDKQKAIYHEKMELDFSLKTKFGTRFRVNSFMTINGPAAVLRSIPDKNITLLEISAPEILADLCKLKQGLVLVVGPTGSGKSTTLAATINHINDNYKRHIITIEDPVEFTYKSNLSLVNQREVGFNTVSFPSALRSALREDPDVIMVGEMRDLETIRLALTAAETGHLVMATLHTNSAAQSINRIIDVFPFNDKDLVRSMLSSSLKAIVSQRLVKKDGGGRVAVYEVMIANSSIRNLIREDKIPQISSMIEIGRKQGMITVKDSILDLFNRKIISKETAEDLLSAGRC
jgi:twitching motility protein PilT